MADGPIEIKVTLDKSAVQRDLQRMKAAVQKDNPKPEGGFKTDPMASSGRSGGPGFERPAFPSGVGTGQGQVAPELPKAAQKEIGKLIGGELEKTVPKLVEKEAKSILPQLFKSFAKGGIGGAARFAGAEALEAAGGAEGIAGAVAGEAGAGAIGLAGAAVTYAGVAALVAIGVKKAFDQVVTGGEFLSTLTAAMSDEFKKKFPGIEKAAEEINKQTAELEKAKAEIETLISSAKRTLGLEESRLLLGGTTNVASDFSRIHDLQVRKQREEEASNRQNRNEASRYLVKQMLEGLR